MTGHGVLVLTGPPCAGKSSVGRLLATDSVYVQIDALFDLLLPGSDRNRHDRMLAYDAAHAVARTVFERGMTPILECTYARHEQRASLLKAVPAAQLWVVEFFVSPDDAVRRFRRRREGTDLDEELVREHAETFPYSDQALRLVSSTTTPAESADRITAWMRSQPGPVHADRWVEAGKDW